MNESALRKVIRLYYGFQLTFSLLLWIPIFYEFQKRIGLSDAEIFSIQTIYYVAFCLLEIPTGILADRMGARTCMRLGSLIVVASSFLPIFAQSYTGFLIHFLLIALSRSLISGASSAYLYEFLRRNQREEEYKEIEGNARAYGLIGKIVLWSGIGALMEWHLTLPYWLTLASTSFSVFFAFALPEVLASTERAAAFSGEKLKEVGRYLVLSPVLVLVMLQGISLFVLDRILQLNLFQPILAKKGFDLAAYGAVMAFMTVFETLGALSPGLSRRWGFKGPISDLNAIFFLTLVIAAVLASFDVTGKSGALAAFAVFSFSTGLAYPIQRSLMNRAITDSRHRATLLSVESILDRAANAWVASQIGAYVAGGRLGEFLRLSSAVTVFLMLLLYAAAHVYSRRAVVLR